VWVSVELIVLQDVRFVASYVVGEAASSIAMLS
jgi:hypothetical protein